MRLARLALFSCAAALQVTAGAQTITFSKIVDEESPVRGNGAVAALHNGEVAFLGYDVNTSIAGIYRAPADGSGPLTLVVDQLTPIPNRPGAQFDYLDNPSIFNGQVIFTGGDAHDVNDGIYRGSGGPIEVLVDRIGGDPAPAWPSPDAAGVTFYVHPSFSETPYFQPADLSGPVAMATTGSPAPGGGTFDSFAFSDTPALGGRLASFTASVAPLSIDHGIYTYDVDTGALDWIANGTTAMPDTELTFDFFTRSDTDGESVVFVGSSGFVCCGGRRGLYLAPAGSSGAGPFTVVAERGQPVPDGPAGAVFTQLGDAAVDGDLVVFQAEFGNPSSGGVEGGLYGYQKGILFKIIDSTDSLDGQDIYGPSITHRSLDGNQVAFHIGYVDPTANNGVGLANWVATIVSVPVAVADAPGGPSEGVTVTAVSPNPFSEDARVTLRVAVAQRLAASVYDALGRRVAELYDGEIAAGSHELRIDGLSLPSGVYVVRVAGETGTAAKRFSVRR